MLEFEQGRWEGKCPLEDRCRLHMDLKEEKKINEILKDNLKIYKQDFSDLLKAFSRTLAIRLYVERVSQFPEVEAVNVYEREDITDIWTVISEADLNVEEKIAEAQCELMRIHRELDFDFMILPRYEKRLEDILPRNQSGKPFSYQK